MVGDIIQDPLGNFVSGAVAVGAWTVNQVWQTQYDTARRTSEWSQQFLNGFTTDDLVDVPPPPAEDLGTVTPEGGGATAGKSVQGASDSYTWEDYVREEVENERRFGIQSPLGPEDPSGVLAPVPVQQKPKDPQAPLKPGFAPSPDPGSRATAGSNQILKKVGGPLGIHNGPGTENGKIWPVFRGQSGAKKNIEVQFANIFAVPTTTEDGVSWKARIQTLKGTKVTATWEMDAGAKAPSGGEFKMLFSHDKQDQGFVDILDVNFPSLGVKTTIIPLTQSTAPELMEVESWSIDRDPWEQVTDVTYPPGTVMLENGEIVSPTPPEREEPISPVPIPKIPFPPAPPVKPDFVVPLNPNNPVAQPKVGTDGGLAPVKGTIPITGTDAHKVGDTVVNSGGMRKDIAAVAGEVGRIEQKTANTLRSLGNVLDGLDDFLDILDKLLPAEKYPAKELSMNAFCDLDAEGEPLTMSISYPEEEMLKAILSRLDDIPAWLEQHLAWKTPTCKDEKPKLLGSWVTTRWLSDGDSPNGERRLRKLFRYRTQSARTNEQLSSFWNGFTWQAGPTLVQHKGAWWGTPAVWATNANEGKRVIRFAAGEAGINPDLDGEWIVGSSSAPRFGMEGTMRLAPLGRRNHVVSRDGSDGYPNDD